MIISLVVFYKIFIQEDVASNKPAPIYHKTWKDEVPTDSLRSLVEGYPASSYAKSLEMVVY